MFLQAVRYSEEKSFIEGTFYVFNFRVFRAILEFRALKLPRLNQLVDPITTGFAFFKVQMMLKLRVPDICV